MTALAILKPGYVSVIASGGESVLVGDNTIGARGGVITNPLWPIDQGLPGSESLWVNLLGLALTSAINGSVEIVPGQSFLVPPGASVWVNAVSSGHKFSAYFLSNYVVPYPPLPVPQPPGFVGKPFPPPGVTGLTTVIPSYLYQEYSDDDDLQGFVAAQNQMQQDYVDTFNALNLPIYPGPIVAGKLLDWVGAGLYGMPRPALSTNQPILMGPLNTWGPNWIYPNWDIPPTSIGITFGLNEIEQLSVGNIVNTSDDLYRRILTWHFFKGDGKYFNVRWLKRRVWRFLYGKNGIPVDWVADPMGPTSSEDVGEDGDVPYLLDADDACIANTQQISVTLGVHKNVTIRFVLGKRTVTGGALLNAFGCNGFEPASGVFPPMDIGSETQRGITLNDIESTYVPYPPLPYMSEFNLALQSGYLEVPFQFNFTCQIG